jgi:peptidyl-prolyl cis-trans isomerase C
MMGSWRATAVVVAMCGAACAGCDDDALQPTQTDGGTVAGLTSEQAKTVVARVGEEKISVGDFAAALERMNQFDRLRYQTKERRRAFLHELIDLELLAQEAKRRGLDKRPEVQEAIRQILRDAILADARSSVEPPAGYTAAQVQNYYDEHKDAFREPERRRVAVIVMGDEGKAKEVLGQAAALTTGAGWGDLYFDHSLDAPQARPEHAPADLAGDLGIVGPPGDAKGANKGVPDTVRKAVFEIDKVGGVHSELAQDDGRFFVVRLAGLSKGHTRSLEEADRVIRLRLMQARIRNSEQALDADLRKRFPVQVDAKALAEIALPAALKGYKPFWAEGAGGAAQ